MVARAAEAELPCGPHASMRFARHMLEAVGQYVLGRQGGAA